MIRLFKPQDIAKLVELWYDASVIAHDFIEKNYWEEKKKEMAEIYIPNSETYVYEQAGQIIGFVSLLENYIAAIFVAPAQQGKGVGKALMQFVKQQRKTLTLGVYAKNINSIAFYKKQGFVVVEEKIDEPTGEQELVMACS
ncbi:putative acetyltransferase [Mesonia hippocampi]|uniref:Putative acetyltransferase n=1 Tax=Mesonia hippocampi TaxID=1628250 RepID=A0A840ESK3_9FLAO|nr:N-acetyltransferase [Mesonia hippocampi]MBB4120025.1 putative acetyltransferase [Mesonia hippocampi]